MTFAKYKRLFLVLLFPLLLAGAVAAVVANKDYGLVSMRCEPFMSGVETCRSTGWGEYDDRIKQDSPGWFDVHARSYEKNSFPEVFASASQRQINDVQILDVTPYAGTDDSPGSPLAQLRSLGSQNTSIMFGIPDNNYRLLNPLGCNELDLDESASGIFTAELCGIPNGLVHVRFRVSPQGQQQLLGLKQAVDEETSNNRQTMIVNYVTITPVFVLLFLIISCLVWTVRRAGTYVAAG